jgi:predicted ATP-grasp superfamily ATP-dependent carboligase
MKIKLKKHDSGKVHRLEASGEIKEILINQDFIEPKKVSVSLCFKGDDSSGIVELLPEEFDVINREITYKKNILKKVKILKFKKE